MVLTSATPKNINLYFSSESLENQGHYQQKLANFKLIFQQEEINTAFAEQEFLKQWTREHFPEVRNALQTLKLSINNLFVAIGFINSLDITLRKAVIIAFFNSK